MTWLELLALPLFWLGLLILFAVVMVTHNWFATRKHERAMRRPGHRGLETHDYSDAEWDEGRVW